MGKKKGNNKVSSIASGAGGGGSSGGRTVLTIDTTYYVSTTGSNTGAGSQASPWLTIQHAVNVIAATLDIASFTVTIQLADGTYTSGVTIPPFFGGGSVNIQGHVGDATKVTLTDGGAGFHFTMLQNLPWEILTNYIWLTMGNTSDSFLMEFECQWQCGNLIFNGGNSCFNFSAFGAQMVVILGPITLQSNYNYYVVVFGLGLFVQVSRVSPITFVGTPNFNNSFVFGEGNMTQITWDTSGTPFTGTFSGKEFELKAGAYINSFGANLFPFTFFPGTVSGTISSDSIWNDENARVYNANSDGAYIVSTLPSVAVMPIGQTAFVTDATLSLSAGLGTVVAGLGGNATPVYSDGTNWRIG